MKNLDNYTRTDVLIGGLWFLSFIVLAISAGLRLAS